MTEQSQTLAGLADTCPKSGRKDGFFRPIDLRNLKDTIWSDLRPGLALTLDTALHLTAWPLRKLDCLQEGSVLTCLLTACMLGACWQVKLFILIYPTCGVSGEAQYMIGANTRFQVLQNAAEICIMFSSLSQPGLTHARLGGSAHALSMNTSDCNPNGI